MYIYIYYICNIYLILFNHIYIIIYISSASDLQANGLRNKNMPSIEIIRLRRQSCDAGCFKIPNIDLLSAPELYDWCLMVS